ncbi:MAG: hypothetical protein JWM36_893 [Hyphomicrobiales bacterium]|nr:hypothetical protein [Hyphomicrobiales bacterium]
MTKRSFEWGAGLVLSTLLATSTLAQTPPARRAPADLCVELVAFLHKDQKKPEGAPTAGGSVGGTAVQAPAAGSDRPTAGGSDNPQQTSGLSAPVTHGGTGASGPQGQAQESAPTAKENPKVEGKAEVTAANKPAEPAKPATPPAAAAQAPVAPEPKPEVVQEAEAAANAGDQLACRGAAQKMRRAGVALPLPLIALAALDPKFLPPKTAGQGGAGADGANP